MVGGVRINMEIWKIIFVEEMRMLHLSLGKRLNKKLNNAAIMVMLKPQM